jgi:glycosyltransferase involved in cell wall biosynthesis
MSQPFISVIICTYNRVGMLKGCIESIINQNFPKNQYEIVVADDGSEDGTADLMRGTSNSINGGGPAIEYHQGAHLGVNATRNAGLRRASGKIIVFCDDDTLAPPDHLQTIWNTLEENRELDGLGGPLRDTGKSGLKTCSNCSLADAYFPVTEKQNMSELIGGNMAIRASLFESVGTFDEEISGRGDETEWFRRAVGRTFRYDPNLWVWHRRDGFNLLMLCKLAFRQGLAVPVFKKKTGVRHKIRPLKIFRFIGHALTRNCARGISMAFREIGATIGYMKTKHVK